MKFPKLCLVFMLVLCGCGKDGPNGVRLEGVAEDLWGNKIDLSKLGDATTLIEPFSPSNCGYCLFDGQFIKENYLEPNTDLGGASFQQCLFNPQLDIATYVKHYGSETIPVLTYPPELHRYHRDGFPHLIAFRRGAMIYSGGAGPYEDKFNKLEEKLWPGANRAIRPTSPIQLANHFIYSNDSEFAVIVHADGDSAALKRSLARLAGGGLKAGTAKFESDLTEGDLEKNLRYMGRLVDFRFDALDGREIPLSFKGDSVVFGGCAFPKPGLGLVACFPNPRNRHRYISCYLTIDRGEGLPGGENWTDLSLFRRKSPDEAPAVFLRAILDKSDDNIWRYAPAATWTTGGLKAICREGACPAPAAPKASPEHPRAAVTGASATIGAGISYTFGASACRFPALAVDAANQCWVAWGEGGDILLAPAGGDSESGMAVEHDASDSFNPLLAFDGEQLWIIYLNNRTGFYRVVAKCYDGLRLSEEILLSEPGLFDAVSPAVTAGRNGDLVIAWSEWRANFRYPKYRAIRNRVLGAVEDLGVLPVESGYINAWSASLAFDREGNAWGAWNQHYPAFLGVCAGYLGGEASSVTRLGASFAEHENGGYPCAAACGDGERWVLWESFGWDVVEGKAQKIRAAVWDSETEAWSLPYTLSLDDKTAFNQTPRCAVDDNDTLWAVWSGRPREGGVWGVYLSHYVRGAGWSGPRRLSPAGETARAPQIAAGGNGDLWIAWHAGAGDQMRIRVLKLAADAV